MHSKKNPEPGAEELQSGTETPTNSPEAASPAEKSPADRVKELEALNAELEDKYLRKAADFENFRKRMFKEKEEARLYATTELLVDLVSLLDDFDRAIASSESGKDWKTLHDGVQMIQKAFLGKLEGRYGLKRFDSCGEPFDPARHEAMLMERQEGLDQAIVKEEFMKGYALHERVIRPAKVKVAMPPEGSSAPAPAAAAAPAPQVSEAEKPAADGGN